MAYTNSPLVAYTRISPNKTVGRNHVIDTITIHCVVGQLSIESLGGVFANTSRQASSNYGVGPDGRIGMYVEEKDRSWCTSSASNDNRAVTIEVASDTKSPYAVTDSAYKGLIQLVADICKRNGIKQLLWKGDKSLIGQVTKQNMTVHRWFANKSCPGDYLYSRHSDIANQVNAILSSSNIKPPQPAPSKENKTYVGKGVGSAIARTDMSVRSGSSTSATAIGTVFSGQAVEVLEILSNGWYKIVWPGASIGFGYTSNVNNAYYNYTPYKAPSSGSSGLKFAKNDVVRFLGGTQYASSNATSGSSVSSSRARVTNIAPSAKHPYHLRAVNDSGSYVSGVYGWVDASKVAAANTVVKKSNEDIAREVIAGKWGSGIVRKRNLEAAGYNYTEIQRIVNKMLA